ncbi:hypothetical protein FHS81_001874 [Pseudochelatococcus contaminans]|uniref:Uncharacterized protein n=1 Tax=Pseudochelatococcus contaminans TaxID=1538103 RepID=A0A7W5Z435_9HYPH|nr:hypothetical protein [Pseudochelatococcus contaminans]
MVAITPYLYLDICQSYCARNLIFGRHQQWRHRQKTALQNVGKII